MGKQPSAPFNESALPFTQTFKDSGGAARKLREAIFMDGVLNETDLTVGKQYSGGFTQIHDFT